MSDSNQNTEELDKQVLRNSGEEDQHDQSSQIEEYEQIKNQEEQTEQSETKKEEISESKDTNQQDTEDQTIQSNQQTLNTESIKNTDAENAAADTNAAQESNDPSINDKIQPSNGEGLEKLPMLKVKTLSQDRNSDDSAINQVCAERKKEAFNQLRAWDDKRTIFITKHKAIVDDLLSRVDKRVKVSQESLGQVLRFFKERKDQEQTYFKVFSTKIPQLNTLWKDPADPKIDWYPALTQALNEIDLIGDTQSKNVLALVQYIDQDIIKNLLITARDDLEKKVKVIRSNISDQQSRLEKAGWMVTKKSEAYTQLYQTMMGPEAVMLKQKKKRKDLLNVEVKFRQAAFDHILEEKELGKLLLNYWEEARKMECTQLEVIQKAFQFYLTKHLLTYGSQPQTQQTLLNFQKFETLKESGDHFSIAKILTPEATSTIKSTLDVSSALTWQDLEKYFVNINFKDISISQHPLVQKKFKIMRDVGSITKSFRECWMVATVDDILLFYDEIDEKNVEKKGSAITDGGKKVNNQPKKVFQLDYLKAKPRDDPSLIDIIEKIPGLLFSSTHKQLIKFIREDDFEEFKVFMIRYQAEQQATQKSGAKGGIHESNAAAANLHA